MRRKLLAGILTVCMAFGTITTVPAISAAQEAANSSIAEATVTATSYMFIGDSGNLVTQLESQETDIYNTGATTDKFWKAHLGEDGVVTLTLCNMNLSEIPSYGDNGYNLIYAKGDLKIEVIGDNYLSAANDSSVYGIQVLDGTLHIKGKSNDKTKDSLTIDMMENTIRAKKSTTNYVTDANIIIEDMSLSIRPVNEKSFSSALSANNNLTIQNSNVSVEQYKVHRDNCVLNAIEARLGTMTVADSSINVGVIPNEEDDYEYEYGSCIYAKTLDMNNSKVKIRNTSNSYDGLCTDKTLVFTNNEMDINMSAEGHGTSFDTASGILKNSSFLIEDGQASSSGIQGVDLTMEGCVLECTGAGLGATNLDLSNCNMTMQGKISAYDSIHLEGNDIEVSCGSTAIIADYITIQSGVTKAYSETSEAIGGYQITINSGEHEFTGAWTGLSAMDYYHKVLGTYTQNGGTVKVSSKRFGDTFGGIVGAMHVQDKCNINSGTLDVYTQEEYMTSGIYGDYLDTVISGGNVKIHGAGSGIIGNTYTILDGTVEAFADERLDYDDTRYGIKVKDFYALGGKTVARGAGKNNIGILSDANLDTDTSKGEIKINRDAKLDASGSMAAVLSKRRTQNKELQITDASIQIEDPNFSGQLATKVCENIYYSSETEELENENVWIQTILEDGVDNLYVYDQDDVKGALKNLELPETQPTDTPTATPTATPTTTPTDTPTTTPTDTPTATPTDTPTTEPTDTPVTIPTDSPVTIPTDAPTTQPTETPSQPPVQIVSKGSIEINGNSWKTLVDNLVFDFKMTKGKEITITSNYEDDLIEYFIDEVSEDAVHALTKEELQNCSFIQYDSANKPVMDKKGNYVVYARITSKSGNITYIGTDAIVVNQDENVYKLGDINMDHELDLQDANMTLKAALLIIDIDTSQLQLADVNKNGEVDLGDANMILKAALGIINIDE